MTIGTPQDLGVNSSSATPTSLAITTTNNIVAHDVILVPHYVNSGASVITGITDGSSNVYQPLLVNATGGTPQIDLWVCYNAIALASGGTITATFTGVATRHGVNALRIPGLLNAPGAWDVHTGAYEVSTGTSSPNTAVRNYGATNEIIIGIFVAGTAPGAFTAGTGFTALNTSTAGAAWMYTQYQIVSASAYTTTVNNSGTWVNSVLHRGYSVGLVGACSC